RRITVEAVFWSAAASLLVSARGLNHGSALITAPCLDSHRGHAFEGPATRPALLALPEPPLAGTARASSRAKQPHHHKEQRCPTLDGVIDGNTTPAIEATNGRACTIRATGTIAIRGTR